MLSSPGSLYGKRLYPKKVRRKLAILDSECSSQTRATLSEHAIQLGGALALSGFSQGVNADKPALNGCSKMDESM